MENSIGSVFREILTDKKYQSYFILIIWLKASQLAIRRNPCLFNKIFWIGLAHNYSIGRTLGLLFLLLASMVKAKEIQIIQISLCVEY